MKNLITRFCSDECGGGLVEYALIIGLIAIVAVGTVTGVGTKLTASFTNIASKIQ